METFEIRNLTFSYPKKEKKALDSVSLTVSKGDFFVLCGYSGCGKSTLLRSLKPSLSPSGSFSGEIFFCGDRLSELSDFDSASKIGFVMQSPENQTVTDKVWHELAFSLENLGFDNAAIRRRTAETATFFGIENLLSADVSTLSGGQKQLLALACVTALQPEVIILDEPTSQLDPIAASEFLSVLSKINREIGTTVIMSEHRLEEAAAYANKAAVMEKGRILCVGTPEDVGLYLKKENSPMFLAMPTPMRVWGSVETELSCPLNVNQGREFLSGYTKTHTINAVSEKRDPLFGEEILSAKELWFRYERDLPDVVKGFELSVHRGEFFCILGSNGAGKTTALKVLGGLKKAYRGQITRLGSAAYLPQQSSALFVKKTVLEDLYEATRLKKMSREESEKQISQVASLCRITDILNCHPHDISGGEQQKAAIAKLLLLSPDILLLDEPTKGLDVPFKNTLAEILLNLKNSGKCIVMVSHDIEFCAQYADRCGLFFDGGLVSVSKTSEFFSHNSFYTTAADRMSRGIIGDCVTTDDVIEAIGGERAENTVSIEKDLGFQVVLPEKESIKKLPLFRKIGAGVCAVIAFILLLISSAEQSFADIVDGEGLTQQGIKQLALCSAFIFALILLAVFLGGEKKISAAAEPFFAKEKLPKRTVFSASVSLLLVPLTLFIGFYLLPLKQYYITAVLVLFECMLPFALIFEGRKPKAREIVVISVLCAIGVAGRAAFFMLPQFKPVAAIVIISGVMLGAQSGFLVGAVTMLVSNMLFSQGPWTPWQMFAMGMIGFIAGILAKKGLLGKSKVTLCLFGLLSTYIIYGGIVNASTALIWSSETLNLKILLSYYISGFPMDTVHAFSTVIFLWFGAQPIMDILERVKVKYALNDPTG